MPYVADVKGEPTPDLSPSQRRLIGVLREADYPLHMSSFGDRLRKQKLVCVLQAAGLPLGYHFSWYRRGPYSPDLARDLYAISRAVRAGEGQSRSRLAGPERSRVTSLLSFLGPRKDEEGYMELLGSAVFWLSQGRRPAETVELLVRLKPRFASRRGEVEQAVQAWTSRRP